MTNMHVMTITVLCDTNSVYACVGPTLLSWTKLTIAHGYAMNVIELATGAKANM